MKPCLQANISQEYFYQKLLNPIVFDQAMADERRGYFFFEIWCIYLAAATY